MVTIIDYGAGNIGSVLNMCRKVGIAAEISSEPAKILAARQLILPGVGHFDHGMRKLTESGLVDPLREAVVENGIPILGICLGMQLMFDGSDEGELAGLGWIPGRVRKFPDMADDEGNQLKVPHMGWTNVNTTPKAKMYSDWEDEEIRFYFVHSYYCDPANASDVSGMAHYGIDFCCSIEQENVWAAQYHPEKSHRHGMRFFKNALQR